MSNKNPNDHKDPKDYKDATRTKDTKRPRRFSKNPTMANKIREAYRIKYPIES